MRPKADGLKCENLLFQKQAAQGMGFMGTQELSPAPLPQVFSMPAFRVAKLGLGCTEVMPAPNLGTLSARPQLVGGASLFLRVGIQLLGLGR